MFRHSSILTFPFPLHSYSSMLDIVTLSFSLQTFVSLVYWLCSITLSVILVCLDFPSIFVRDLMGGGADLCWPCVRFHIPFRSSFYNIICFFCFPFTLLYCNISLFPLYFIILYLHGYLYSALTLLHLVCNQHDNILNLTPGFLFICFYIMTSHLLYLQPFRT